MAGEVVAASERDDAEHAVGLHYRVDEFDDGPVTPDRQDPVPGRERTTGSFDGVGDAGRERDVDTASAALGVQRREGSPRPASAGPSQSGSRPTAPTS